MARPVRVTDTAIFEATLSIILEEGLEKVTFERIAQKVGLVRTAVANRFKNKHLLLVAADAYYLAQSRDVFEKAAVTEDDPLQAIISGLGQEMRFATSPKAYRNGLALLAYGFGETEILMNYQRAYLAQRALIISLLEQAKQEKMLRPEVAARELAEQLQAAQQGAAHAWMVLQDASIEEHISRHIQAIIKPQLVEQPSSKKKQTFK